MNQFLRRAEELAEETVRDRRTVHQFAGTGFDLPETTSYVVERLREMGLAPEVICPSGVVCTIGRGEKTFLLRADMDALPMEEESGLPFAATNGTSHSCGHDCHTAMLLCAARMLKEREEELSGTVKLMFQPAEEGPNGCDVMIEAGVLENPKVDAAFAMHVTVGNPDYPTGSIQYCEGVSFGASDMFEIRVNGIGCHAAYPSRGVDPINIGSRIVTAAQSAIAQETPVTEQSVISFGQFHAGTAHNIIPDSALLAGTIRALSRESRAFLKQRLREIAEKTAAVFRGTAEVEYSSGTAPLINDGALRDELLEYCQEIVAKENIHKVEPVNGSEDFAAVSERVPTFYFWIGAGTPEEGCAYGVHHPKMRVNEAVLPIGAAIHANCAFRWLQAHAGAGGNGEIGAVGGKGDMGAGGEMEPGKHADCGNRAEGGLANGTAS